MSLETCPNCGAELPRRAKVCPECGSDENTGWSEDSYASGLDLPDENFNYDEFIENEFGQKKKIVPRGIHWFWWIVAVVIVSVFVFFLFRR
jgi:uncharacterized membrane protein YvbJ